MRYRVAGTITWCAARTENISRTGVLFRTDRPLDPSTRIELSIDLLDEGSSRARVHGRGLVVRATAFASPDTHCLVAAATSGSRIIRA